MPLYFTAFSTWFASDCLSSLQFKGDILQEAFLDLAKCPLLSSHSPWGYQATVDWTTRSYNFPLPSNIGQRLCFLLCIPGSWYSPESAWMLAQGMGAHLFNKMF